MLHTLNEAWTSILVRQACKNKNKRFLFVAKDQDEKKQIIAFIRSQLAKLEVDLSSGINLSISTETAVKATIAFCKFYNEEFMTYDDILISQYVHDNMLHSYLCKHKSS